MATNDGSAALWTKTDRYHDWAVIPWTFTVSDDRSIRLFFILSPDSGTCALVRNDIALCEFGARGVRYSATGCEAPIADAIRDDLLGGVDDEDDGLDDDSERDDDDDDGPSEWDQSDEAGGQRADLWDEAEAAFDAAHPEWVNFSDLNICMNPKGDRAMFTISKGPDPFIFQLFGGARAPLVAGSLISAHFHDATDNYLLSATQEDEGFFIHNGQYREGYVHQCAFSECGKHLVAFLTTTSEGKGSVSVYINDRVVLSADGIQSWGYPGEGGTEATCRERHFFDPKCRYMLFGTCNGKGKEEKKRTVYLVDLRTYELHNWPEVRILSALWNTPGDCFEVDIASAANQFRKPLKLFVPGQE